MLYALWSSSAFFMLSLVSFNTRIQIRSTIVFFFFSFLFDFSMMLRLTICRRCCILHFPNVRRHLSLLRVFLDNNKIVIIYFHLLFNREHKIGYDGIAYSSMISIMAKFRTIFTEELCLFRCNNFSCIS